MVADTSGMDTLAPDLAEWGRRVAARRRTVHISQVHLAVRCGIDPSTLSRIERGVVAPNDFVKARIAHQLGEAVLDLFPWDKNEQGSAA